MQVLVTDQSNENGINSVEMMTEKHHAYVSVSSIGVSVLVKPINQRLFGTGRNFETFADAITAYKMPAAKIMIEEAQRLIA